MLTMTQSASGVYEILNTVNGKRYVGQTSDFTKRWSRHRVMLRNGTHDNKHLQSAYVKHGVGAFQFNELARCHPKALTWVEQSFMDLCRPEYNKAPAAGSRLGCKQPSYSAESRAKMSVAMKGNTNGAGKRSPEHCAAISARQIGTVKSADTKARISEAKRGKPWSAARRAAQENRMSPVDSRVESQVATV